MDLALPRALGAVARCVYALDDVEIRLSMSGRYLPPVIARMRNQANVAAARSMINGLFAPAPSIRARRRSLI